MKVIEQDGDLYLEESLSPESPMFISGERDQTIQYIITKIEGERILLPTRFESALFYFYGNDTLQLNPSNRWNLEQNDCRLDIAGDTFIGDGIGDIGSFEVGSVKINNKMAVSCVPPFFSLEAYLFYDSQKLYASHTILTDVTSEISGWVLKEE